MQAYREAIATEESSLVLAPTGDFFRYFQDMSGGLGEIPSRDDPGSLSDAIREMLISPEDEAGEGLGLAPEIVAPMAVPAEEESFVPPAVDDVGPPLPDDAAPAPQ